MKRSIAAGLALLLLAAGAIALVLVVTSDVVTTKYATLEDARKDRLFERGWLPDILPPSARDIRVSNDLDLGTSEGRFRFDARESAMLSAKLSMHKVPYHPFENWDAHIEKKRKVGFAIGSYKGESSDWIFFCRFLRGECEYVMWGPRLP